MIRTGTFFFAKSSLLHWGVRGLT